MYGRGLDGAQLLNPGALRHQITWQEKVVSGQNASGEDVFTWTDFLRCRAQVNSMAGRGEYQDAMQRYADAKYVLRQHYSRGVTSEMRIAWLIDGAITYLDVLSIDPGSGDAALPGRNLSNVRRGWIYGMSFDVSLLMLLWVSIFTLRCAR
jgi:SPP1 family predicted phage head-tail adaptor